MRVAVDHDSCIASGACVLYAAEVLTQDEDGIVVVLQRTPPPEFIGRVEAAIRACPAGVIRSEDERTDESPAGPSKET